MVSNPIHGQISALASLISDATKIVEAHYAASSKPLVPSLGDTSEHPVDQVLDSELRNAIQIIEGACAQLSATVARPSHTIVNKLMGFKLSRGLVSRNDELTATLQKFYEPACLGIVLTFKIPDVLEEKPAGMHISEIAEKTGLEERKIGRILRLLATKHVFTEVSENVFANNRLSVQLLSDNPISSLGGHFTEECIRSTCFLAEVLGDKEWGPSYSAAQTAFNRWSKQDDTMFAFIENTPEGRKLGARFGTGMMGWGAACQGHDVVHEFPWKELGDGATVCDLGGGVGNIALQLAKAYPTLQLKLQDLPETIKQAENHVWPEKCPEAIEEKRVVFKPINFFKESPIAGCNIYFLKNIIHDWPAEDCVAILSNVRKVMEPHSRILIHEYILQDACRVPDDQTAFKQAPAPLLPNYGAGRIRQYNLDLDMMTMLNSEERRLPDFIHLGEMAGLRFVKLWDLGETGVVEFRLP